MARGPLGKLRRLKKRVMRWLDDLADEPLRREGLLPPRESRDD